MTALDALNTRYGCNTVRTAAQTLGGCVRLTQTKPPPLVHDQVGRGAHHSRWIGKSWPRPWRFVRRICRTVV
ncbi:MAG: DUF4113 domain-containing protein [Lewinellaceae bacterium]|nr:DUF4113 domain-containing protein [Lewinellaceae bacterium]